MILSTQHYILNAIVNKTPLTFIFTYFTIRVGTPLTYNSFTVSIKRLILAVTAITVINYVQR